MNKQIDTIQYNVHNGRASVMAPFLRDPRVLTADVIAIQEPWRNEFTDTTHQPAKATHQLLYPKKTEHRDERPARVCIFISKKIDPARWTHIVVSRDYQIVRINSEWRTIYIHNIYNEPRGGTITRIREEIERIRIGDRDGEHMILGDFNLHHPSWGGAGTRGDAEAEDLLEIMDIHDMEIVTEPGVAPWERKDQKSTIDLTFISNGLLERLVNCVRGDDIDHDSDHWLIRTVLDITVPQKTPEKRRNWKEMDAKLFLERLDLIDVPDLSRTTKRRIELQTVALMATIRRAIEASTPWARPSQYANPDFTGECRDAIKLTRRLRRQFTRTHQPGIWVQYCIARNQKKRLIDKQLRQGHRQRVQ